MSQRRLALVPAVLVGAAALAVPAAASARTKTVEVGPFPIKIIKQHPKVQNVDLNAFFRKVVTIHRGDRVRWMFNGFHTVTFAPQGAPRPGIVAPNGTVSGANDAAGQPFWFNGQLKLSFNPQVFLKQGGGTFTPSKLQGSGVPAQSGRPKPYTLKFTRTGTFDYFCAIHPGMEGKVRVLSRGRKIPSARADRREAAREATTVVRQALRLRTGVGTPKAGIVQAGNDRRDGATVYEFFPHTKTIPVGTTLTFRMAPQSTEDHTFTFATPQSDKFVKKLAKSFESPTGPDPAAVYASESPASGAVPDYDGTNHGDGFLNSGVLDASKATPLPSSFRVRFTKAGTYNYICLVHPFMHGKVVVK